MAVLYQCDRCERQFKSVLDLREIKLPHLNFHQNGFTEEEVGYKKDVCAQCARDMKASFDAGIKEKLNALHK